MINVRSRDRPDCYEILNIREQWALNENEFDIEAEMKKIRKNDKKFVYKIIKTKFNRNSSQSDSSNRIDKTEHGWAQDDDEAAISRTSGGVDKEAVVKGKASNFQQEIELVYVNVVNVNEVNVSQTMETKQNCNVSNESLGITATALYVY
jgi:hypothetical protein